MILNKNLTDEEIVSLLCIEGNLRYFTILAERYETHILKRCKSYVKDDDTAEDLCQEILLKVYLNLKSFKGTAHFSTWLFSIIHNTCIDYIRRNKKNEYKVITEKMVDEVAEMIEGVDELSKEVSEQVLENTIAELSQEDQLLLLMKYKEKYSIKEIQRSMHLSESAIKMRLKRAREKANKLYQQAILKK